MKRLFLLALSLFSASAMASDISWGISISSGDYYRSPRQPIRRPVSPIYTGINAGHFHGHTGVGIQMGTVLGPRYGYRPYYNSYGNGYDQGYRDGYYQANRPTYSDGGEDRYECTVKYRYTEFTARGHFRDTAQTRAQEICSQNFGLANCREAPMRCESIW